jgi:threonine/homoserine/homoserine lactone efflux protein
VLETSFRILLLAVVAGASPMAIVATLAVLTSRRGRTNGLAFLIGFGLGQATAFLIAYLVGSAASAGESLPDMAVVELLFGLGLLALAWMQRRRPEPVPVAGPSRTEAVLRRLQGLRPWTAFAVGALLGVGGLKRLSITLVAGATVAVAGLGQVESLGLAAVYIIVSGVLVWVPVVLYVIAGSHADAVMTVARDWVTANERSLTFYSTTVFGVLLTADGILRSL